MNPTRVIEVELGRVKLRVPVYTDERTTRLLVDRVNERLAQIEAESDTVNTLVFAMQAALSFAIDAHESEALRAEERGDILKVLHRIGEALKNMIEETPDGEEEN